MINSGPGIVPLTDRDQFYWLVESIDGIGQGSDPNKAFGRGEKLEFDQTALNFSNNQIEIIRDSQGLPLDSVNTFATGTSIHFRWNAPELIRLFGDESVYIIYDRNGSLQHAESLSGLSVETDTLDFIFQMPSVQVNGTASLFLEGFKDRAGNSFGSRQVVFKVDNGPEVKVKIFQNPIDPTSFGFVFKGKDYHGLDDILLFEPDRPSPQVFISEGFRRLEELPIVPLRQTIIDGKDYANGFSGSFFVDKQFVGDVILNITAEDFRGFSSNQDVVLHVLPIENSYNRSITKIDGSSKAFNYRVLNSSTDNNFVVAAPRKFVDLKNLPPSISPSKRLTLSNLLHFFGNDRLWTEQSGTILVGEDCQKAIFLSWTNTFKPLLSQDLNCDSKGSLSYTIQSTDISKTFLMQDLNPPLLEFNYEEELPIDGHYIELRSQDDLSGVSQVWIRLEESKFLLKAEGDDRYTGFVKYPPGEWIAEVLASDYVGNVQRSQMQLTVLRSFGFEQCFVAPNPIANGDQINLNCRATSKPDEMNISLYDSSGKRINRWQALSEVDFKESYEPVNGEGVPLSNGLYFLKIRIRQGNTWKRKTLKLAILRR